MRKKEIRHTASAEKESTLRRFVYSDNNDGGKIVFTFETDDILVADKAFEQAIGTNPAKMP